MPLNCHTVEVFVPMKISKRGGRKWLVVPGANTSNADAPLIQAIVQAHQWQAKFDSGAWATMKELADTERVDYGHFSKIIRLTLLAPDIIESILSGLVPKGLTLTELKRAQIPALWEEQRRVLGFADL